MTLYIDPDRGKGMAAFVLGHTEVKRREKWKLKVQLAAAKVLCCQKNKVRRGHRHDKRSYYGELGFQTRTHGFAKVLKPRDDCTEQVQADAYAHFDKLGVEAEKVWAPLFKAFRLSVHT